MARIYGDQINKYLQFKQGATPKRGIIGDVLVGLTDPFGKLGRSTRGIHELETAKAAGEGENYRPDFMTKEEYETWRKSPGLEALKGGVGVASYLVPGAGALGGGLKGTLASGAISSGAYGFGASKPGEEIETTLKSAVAGAGTAGALYGARKGIQRLKEGGARGRLKSKGLLGGAGDVDIKGGTSGSKLDFNQAVNRYDDIASTLSPEEQAQTLLDIKKITPKDYQGAIDMQIQMRTQSNAPLAQEIDRLGTKGVGKYASKYDPTNPKTMAEQFDEALTGKSPVGQNTLQKKSIVGQYKQMGLTTKKGALDYVDEFGKSTNKLEQAREFFDLPRTPEGMSQLPSKIGGLRDDILDSSTKQFAINADDIATDGVANQIARNTQTTPDQAKAAIYDKLREAIDPEDLAGLTSEQQINLRFTTNPGTLQTIKGRTSDSYLKVIGKAKGKTTVDDYAAAQLHRWADNQLSTIPGYRKLNQTFAELYKANDGFRRAYDTGLRGTYIASPQDAKSRLMNTAFDIGNKQVEKAGNLQARIQAANIPNVGIPTGQIGRAGQRIAPIVAAQGASQGNLNTFDTSGEGDVLGMSVGPSSNFGNVTNQYGVGIQGGSVGQGVPSDLGQRLAMAVLSGQIDVGTAKYLESALGGGGQEKVKLTDTEKKYQLAATAAQDALRILEERGGAGKLANIGGKISSFVGKETAASDYKNSLELANAYVRNALAGTAVTEVELKRLGFIPSANDEPEIARQKLGKLINYLQSYGNLGPTQIESQPSTITEQYGNDYY